jgi:SAM-dependent methyltransferase
MDSDLLSILRCPQCRAAGLRPSPENDRLQCPACGHLAAVARGVPRLSAEPYVASFGRQWNRYDVARDDEDLAVFQAKTGWNPADLAGKLVLDAGCGGGRYARLLGRFGAKVLAVDLSDAVDKAAALCAEFPSVLVAQADLLDLPLADAAFDFAFSIGVLHHSPNARAAFAQVARKVKPGGKLAVWLYRRNTPPQEWINSGLRAVSTRLPVRVLEPICAGMGVLGSLPVLRQSLNKVVNFSNHPDWTLRVCDNFDWYAPKYQSHHTTAELSDWFRQEGYGDLIELSPMRSGRVYDWAYHNDLIIGSGVNVAGRRLEPSPVPEASGKDAET